MMTLFGALVLAAVAQTTARPPAAKPDACRVLTKRDIAAVQGEPFTSAKLTTRDGISQCFYQLPSFAKSVSVDLISGGGEKFWEQHVEKEGGESGEEAEEKLAPPREVGGLGSDAIWAGGRMAGSLYVRKGDSVLRISVGGPGSDAEKMARSKALAIKALPRM